MFYNEHPLENHENKGKDITLMGCVCRKNSDGGGTHHVSAGVVIKLDKGDFGNL